MYKIKDVPYVGPKTLSILYKEGIFTPLDMLFRFPKKYESFIEDSLLLAVDKTIVTTTGIVCSIPKVVNHKPPLKSLQFNILVDNEIYKVVAYRREFLKDQIKENQEIQVKGQFFKKRKLINASKVNLKPLKRQLKPIYDIEGLYDSNISKIIVNIYKNKMANVYETLPRRLIKKRGLMDRYDMVYAMHFPTPETLDRAYKRLKYEEALNFQIKIMTERIKAEKTYKEPKKYDLEKVKEFIKKIPYELTNDQKQAVNDIFKDFKKNYPVKRLIQGDVGSGKTVVVGISIYGAKTSGYQSAFMAPTEILASQHYETFIRMFPNLKVELLTSSTKNKEEIKARVFKGEVDLLIGTHALITDDTVFKNLGFVIIDEQHRFGVIARETLEKKGTTDIVYLTATPIPRTLAIVLFGDMEISNIKEMPKGRKKVITSYFSSSPKEAIYNHVKKEIDIGNNAYFVVPSIESDRGENINTIYEEVKDLFSNVFLLHGQMGGSEKQEIMDAFNNTNGAVLISTTVVEVGLDIKHATIMVIFDGEYFGLSQLHQLRGRVGRSDKQSYCYVVSNKGDIERLKTFEKEDDGFKLSEFDLLDRGPGEFLGVRQSGEIDFKYVDINNDYNLLLTAKEDALSVLRKEEELAYYLKYHTIKEKD